MVEDDSDEARSVDTRVTQRRKTPRVVANGIGPPDQGDGSTEEPGATSSSNYGAPAPTTLAVRENALPNGAGGALAPTAAVLGVDAGAALQPFGVFPNGLPDLAAAQIV